MKQQKRIKIEIIKDILGIILLNRSIGYTRLLYKSNLYPQGFKDYIADLIKKNLITEEIISRKKHLNGEPQGPARKVYNLTELGREYLEDYKAIDNFIEKYDLNEE